MNLEEFKAALESEATKRVDSQEQTIRALHEMIYDQAEKIQELEAEIERLEGGSWLERVMFKLRNREVDER